MSVLVRFSVLSALTVAFAGPAFGANAIATTPYVADLVRELTCEGAPIPLDVLVDGGKDPHDFNPLPSDRVRLAKAPLVLFVHATFETWLGKAISSASSGQSKSYFALAETLPLRRTSSSDPASKGEIDPHIWHSPQLTVQAASRLSERLTAYAPARAATFQKCLPLFTQKVKNTENELRALISALPPAQRILATDHDAFGYFADAFGFQVVTVQGLSTEVSPTPARLKRAIDAVKKSKVKAVFLEAAVPARLMQSVSKETGVRIGGSLYADGLGPKGSGAETTILLWRKNMETIVAALR